MDLSQIPPIGNGDVLTVGEDGTWSVHESGAKTAMERLDALERSFRAAVNAMFHMERRLRKLEGR